VGRRNIYDFRIGELQQLAKLEASGIHTEEEFQAVKAKLLSM
jgi:hypothetical protein